MQEIIKEYGPALLTVVAIVALIVLVVTILKDNGIAYQAFNNLFQGFFKKATDITGLDTPAGGVILGAMGWI